MVGRFDSGRLLITMAVVIITIIVDSEIGLVADFVPEQISSNVGLAAFMGVAIIFAVTQFCILVYIKQTNKENRVKARICYLANHNSTTI